MAKKSGNPSAGTETFNNKSDGYDVMVKRLFVDKACGNFLAGEGNYISDGAKFLADESPEVFSRYNWTTLKGVIGRLYKRYQEGKFQPAENSKSDTTGKSEEKESKNHTFTTPNLTSPIPDDIRMKMSNVPEGELLDALEDASVDKLLLQGCGVLIYRFYDATSKEKRIGVFYLAPSGYNADEGKAFLRTRLEGNDTLVFNILYPRVFWNEEVLTHPQMPGISDEQDKERKKAGLENLFSGLVMIMRNNDSIDGRIAIPLPEPCSKIVDYGQSLKINATNNITLIHFELKCETQQLKKARKEVDGPGEVRTTSFCIGGALHLEL